MEDKKNVKRFVNLLRVWFSHIRWNDTETSLLIMSFFSDMQMSSWLHLSRSLCEFLWGISLCCDIFKKKNRPEKFPFIATNNWIVLAARRSVNYFLLQIPEYFGNVRQKKKKLEIKQTQLLIQSKNFSFHSTTKDI